MGISGIIHRDKEEETTYPSLLSAHFDSVTCQEKYIDANINLPISAAISPQFPHKKPI